MRVWIQLSFTRAVYKANVRILFLQFEATSSEQNDRHPCQLSDAQSEERNYCLRHCFMKLGRIPQALVTPILYIKFISLRTSPHWRQENATQNFFQPSSLDLILLTDKILKVMMLTLSCGVTEWYTRSVQPKNKIIIIIIIVSKISATFHFTIHLLSYLLSKYLNI